MPYDFTVDGWQDWDGNRFDNTDEGGDPAPIEEVQGVFVHATNPDDPEDEHYFWVFIGEPFEEWEEWWVLTAAMMDMYGLSLA